MDLCEDEGGNCKRPGNRFIPSDHSLSMAGCGYCGKKPVGSSMYYWMEVCRKCRSRLRLDGLQGARPPVDTFLNGYVEPKDAARVEAMNLYATMMPRGFSRVLFEMLLEALDSGDEHVPSNAIIIAARAAFLFGQGTQDPERVPDDATGFLVFLGGDVGIAIGQKLAKETGLSGSDEEEGDSLSREFGLRIRAIYTAVFEDLKMRDTGKMLGDSVGKLLRIVEAVPDEEE